MGGIARTLNPYVDSVVRAHSEDDTVLVTMEGIGPAFFGEEELAKGLSAHVGSRFPN
jgi:CPA2 family monovalent cation:H+ antiporter-2